jgi:hypothetical protein
LCMVAPLLVCANEISKIAILTGLQDKIAFSEDGKSFMLIADEAEQDEIEAKLAKHYPNLLLAVKKVEVRYGDRI